MIAAPPTNATHPMGPNPMKAPTTTYYSVSTAADHPYTVTPIPTPINVVYVAMNL